MPISRLPFKYGVAKTLVRHLLAKKIEMAAAESMGLTFVDEDDLPVAFLRIAHVDSDHEAPSDVDSSDEEENSDEEEGESDGEIENSDDEEQNY